MKHNARHTTGNVLLLYITAACIFIVGLWSYLDKSFFLIDYVVAFAFMSWLFYYARRHALPLYVVASIGLGVIIHLLGAGGLYSKFILGPLGYDKFVHFFGGFAACFLVLHMISEKNKFTKCIVAVLIVLGLGALMEINEFVGYRYFHQDYGGIFAIGDNLPEIKSDLQRYDTYFDMIFNVAGGLIAAVTYTVILQQNSHARSLRS